MSNELDNQGLQLDLSDVSPRVGQLVGGGQLLDPCNRTDIRRWVMAMDYVNPLHWDHKFAAKSKFGDIIAPQSMAVALDYGHGCQPACVGRIPGSHLIFGGEEWWWYGTHIKPGDQLFQERRFYDYKATDTKFAGPTLFSRGDTTHRNQRGDLIAKAWSIRTAAPPFSAGALPTCLGSTRAKRSGVGPQMGSSGLGPSYRCCAAIWMRRRDNQDENPVCRDRRRA